MRDCIRVDQSGHEPYPLCVCGHCEKLFEYREEIVALRHTGSEVEALRETELEAFELEILYDKAERRIEVSATVSDGCRQAFEKKKALPKEGSLVY